MYCECGCGEITSIAKQTDHRWGHVRGQHVPYIVGHQNRKSRQRYVIDENGCWVWQGAMNKNGYGLCQSSLLGRVIAAHRVYWERRHGPAPDGLDLDHLCRNRACVNPDHLEPVTHRENVRRGARCRLTLAQARKIKLSTEPLKIVAERFGVSMSMVSQIRRGIVWRDA